MEGSNWDELHNRAYGYNKADCLKCQQGENLYRVKYDNLPDAAIHESDLVEDTDGSEDR